MKRRSTTPASDTVLASSFTTKAVLVATAVLMAVAVPIQISLTAHADTYDDQIKALQQQSDQYQNAANQLSSQADTLQNKLNELSAQANAIQAQITISQAKYDQLQQQIADNEKKITENRKALGTILSDMYVDSDVSPIEMLASSKNIGDYMDKQEYQSTVQKQLTQKINQIKTLKKQLEQQKTQVTAVLNDQKSQRTVLASNQAAQQSLLDETKGNEATYQSKVTANNAQIAQLRASQAAADKKNNSVTVGSSQCGGGYPFCMSLPDSFQSSGGFSASQNARECVNYVQWRIFQITGTMESHGDASGWKDVSNLDSPEPNSVAVMPYIAPYGHVAWVEQVGTGSHAGEVLVSQYNWTPYAYSEQWVPISAYSGFYKNW